MKKILITGGAGFVGSHLAKNLLADGSEVTVVDNFYTSNKENLAELVSDPRFTFILHDVIHPLEGNFDEIYNLACPASPVQYQKDPIVTAKTSVIGTLNVLELAEQSGAKVFQASTSEVYGDPLEHPQKETYWGNVKTSGVRSCYDESKRFAETLCSDYSRQHDLDVRIVRIFNTYGPNMQIDDGRAVSNFAVQFLSDQDITLHGDGSQTRSFQYIDDLMRGIKKYMEIDREDLKYRLADQDWYDIPTLNLGNPAEVSIKDLVMEIKALVPDSKSKIVYHGMPVDDPNKRRPDISLANKILDWYPEISLRDGLKKSIDYFSDVLKYNK